MYSDNEKDFLENLDDSQDNAVSWENILDTDEDGIVSIKNDSSASEADTEVFMNAPGSDEVEFVNDSDDNEIDEDELKRILNENPSINMSYDDSRAATSNSADIQNANVLQDQEPEDILPRKQEVKKQGVSPVLVALLIAVIAGAGAYLFFNFKSQDEEEMPLQNPPVQEENNQENSAENQEENGAIPVVNEEEVDEVKPDEAQDSKKEVVNVVPTGRVNPFLPLDKYLKNPASDITKIRTINNIDYDSLDIPKPPKKYGEISEYTEKLMSITVSGIMYDKVKPSAIITYEDEDYFVQIGDKLNNFKVVDITPTHVMVSLGKNIYKANLGEELKVSEFFGNVKNGADSRQYFSSEDEYTNKKEGKSPYTSNSDVKIYTK